MTSTATSPTPTTRTSPAPTASRARPSTPRTCPAARRPTGAPSPRLFTGNAFDSQTDTVTALAEDNEDHEASATDTAAATLTDVLPTIVVDKTASSADTPTPADEATLDEPGGEFTFHVLVTNTSVEDVTITSLSDSVHGDLTDPGNPALTGTTCTDALGTVLAAPVPPEPSGGSYDCTFSARFRTDAGGILVGDAGDFEDDTVTATAVDDDVPPGGGDPNTATDSDGARVSLTDALPTIEVAKTASSAVTTDPAEEAFLPEPGGEFTFHVLVTNTSVEPVTITGLTDDVYGDITDADNPDITGTDCVTGTTLDATNVPGGTTTYRCAFTATFTGNAFDSQTDTVTALAEDNEDHEASATDTAVATLTDVLPTIVVDKTASSADTPTPADEATLDEPGGEFTFHVLVTNTSVEDVTITSLSDSVHGDLTDPGNPALTGTTCTDALGTVLAAPVPPEPSGGSYDCTFSARFRTDAGGILVGDAGDFEDDTVTATAVDDDVPPGGGDPNTATDSDGARVSLTDALPTIEVAKTASSAVTTDPAEEAFLPEPGGEFTFHVLVTNTSVEPVTITGLTDDVYGDITDADNPDITGTDCVTGTTLDATNVPGGTTTYRCAFTATFTGNAFDSQTDTVTALAEDNEDHEASATDTAAATLTDVDSMMELTKEADPTQVNEPGDDVIFSVSIDNTSFPDTITIDSLVDDIYGDITQVKGDISATDCAVPFDLAPSETYDCEFTAFVSGNAGDVVTDTVTGSGIDDDGFDISDDDTADVEILDVLPKISLQKTADPLTLDEPGGEFTFTIVVTNESVEPVELTSLTDDVYGDITVVAGDITATTCVVPSAIEVAGTYACSFIGTFEGNGGDIQTDIVTGAAQDDEGNPVEATDDAVVELLPVPPVISTTKTPNKTEIVAPAEEVTFTITITNESTFEPVTIDGLTDSVYGDLNGQGSCLSDGSVTLQPGQTYTCRFTAEVTGSGGDTHRNTITVTASDDDPEPVVVAASAPAEIEVLAAPVDLRETNMLPASDAGDPLGSGAPFGDLLRTWVLFMAATILVGALGLAVIRRSLA